VEACDGSGMLMGEGPSSPQRASSLHLFERGRSRRKDFPRDDEVAATYFLDERIRSRPDDVKGKNWVRKRRGRNFRGAGGIKPRFAEKDRACCESPYCYSSQTRRVKKKKKKTKKSVPV